MLFILYIYHTYTKPSVYIQPFSAHFKTTTSFIHFPMHLLYDFKAFNDLHHANMSV